MYTYCCLWYGLPLRSGRHTVHILETVVWLTLLSNTHTTHILQTAVRTDQHIQYPYCRLLYGLPLFSRPHTIHILQYGLLWDCCMDCLFVLVHIVHIFQAVVWTLCLFFWSTYNTHIVDCCVDCPSVFLIRIQYTYCRLLCGLSLCLSDPHTIHILQTVVWTAFLTFWSTYNTHISDCCVDCPSVFLVHIQHTYCRLLCGLYLCLSGPHTAHILQTVVWTVPLSFWSTYNTHIEDCCVDCHSVFLVHIQHTYCRLLCGLYLCLSGPHTAHILQTVVWTVPLSFWSTYNTHISDCCVDCPSVFLVHIQHTYCRLLCGLYLCLSGPHTAHILQTVVWTVPLSFWSTYNTHISDCCVDCPSVFLVHIQHTYCRLLCGLYLCLSGPHTAHILQTVVWTVPLSFWSTYNTHIEDCCVDCHSVFQIHIQHTYCRLLCRLSLCFSGPPLAHILQTVVWAVLLSFWSTYNTHIADCCVNCPSVFLVHIQYTYCRLLCGLSLCLSGPHTAHIL